MATKEALERALRNAHAAGDAAAAQRFAAAIQGGQFENNEGDKVSEGPAPGTPEYAAKVRGDFEGLGALQKFGQAQDDVARIAADSLTFGTADKLASFMGRTPLAQERQKTQDARIRSGSAGDTVSIGSSILGFGKFPSAVGAVREAIPAAIARGRGLIAGTAGGAAEGAAYGAANAAGHDQDVAEGAKDGSLFGVLGQGAAKATERVAGKLDSAADSISSLFKPQGKAKATGTGKYDEVTGKLERDKNRAYSDADTLGIWLSPAASQKVADDVSNAASAFRGGYDDVLDPKVAATVGRVNRILTDTSGSTPVGRPTSLQKVEEARAMVRESLTGPRSDPSEAAFGRHILNQLDDSLEGILANPTGAGSGATTVSGIPRVMHGPNVDPTEASDILKEARDLNSRMRKVQQVDEAMGGAERRAARSTSTTDSTAMRQGLDTILSSKTKRRGFTPDEQSAIDEIVRGTTAMNVGSQLGRLAPGGSMSVWGSGIGGAGGAALGGAPVAAVGAIAPQAVGVLGKKMADKATQQKADELIALIAAGGNKANLPTPTPPIPQDMRDALGRYFMMYQTE